MTPQSNDSRPPVPFAAPRPVPTRPRSLLANAARLLLSGSLLLVAVTGSRSVSADDKGADEKAARAAVQEADRRYQRKDYAGALEQYIIALGKAPSLSVKLRVGRCHLKLNHLARAQEAFRRVVQESAQSAPSTASQRTARDAEEELDALVSRVPQVRFKVKGPHPDDVRIVIDGTPVDPATGQWWVSFDPGPHTVQISAPGRKPTSLPVDAKEGERIVVEASLAEETPP